MRSQSHAWSAIPSTFLIHNLAGFKIVEPGTTKVRLKLRIIDFDYEIKVPTLQGVITVRCENGSMYYKVPQGVEVMTELIVLGDFGFDDLNFV